MLKIKPWQVALVVLICVAGILFALPNVFSRDSMQSYPSWLPREQLNLGLDLQGGSHLVLEVQVEQMLTERIVGIVDEVRARLRGERIGYTGLKTAGHVVQVQVTDPGTLQQAVDLIKNIDRALVVNATPDGRIEAALGDAARDELTQGAVGQSIEIVRRRIDETGTREPTIQRQGSDRVLIQLPGIDDPERVKALLGQTAKLTFHLLDESITPAEARRDGVPPTSMLVPSDKLNEDGIPEYWYVLRKRAILSGESLVDAQPSFQNNEPVVSFRFDALGARRFGDVTKENVGKPFAIVLDGKVISAPVIREPILGGSGVISGSFTTATANDLALLLRAGALPAPMVVIEERTVGPDLGADSIRAGETAAMVGLVAIFVFVTLYYGFFGLVANLALIMNLVLLIAVMSLFQATLTLPGIVGIVLTLGMAVDANVLVFERMREEMKLGKSPFAAMDAGFRRAYSAIIDSNLTTLIAAIVLYAVGTGPVRGFAVSIGIGVVTTMFTAVLLARYLLVWWLRARRPKQLPL
ncbi:MAG: protein translocase subunit SecD [Alphaproteobacteria bacterium]